MASTLNPQPSTAVHSLPVASPSRSLVKTWLPLLLFSVLWMDLVRQLGYTWETNEQYAYGWFVPILALALFIRRWPTRPNPQLSTLKPQPNGPYFSFQLSAFIIFLAVAFLPLRVIHEINQDWPLITWPMTAIVVALTLYALHLADPQSVVRGPWSVVSPWVKHFAFPVCFILVAVKWPYRIEQGLTQNLMQLVATLTVEIIGWFGVPALQRGNLIEISTGVLGVDEACSGIRSFQSTLMAALFLGELYLLRWPIRILLVVAGLAAAFVLNLCRTFILTWQANAHGISAIEKWHDPAGFTIAVACFAVLWILAVLIKRKSNPARPPTTDNGPWTTDSHPQSPSAPGSRFQLSAFSFRLCRRYLIAVGLWSLFSIVATEVWYRSHELRRVDTVHWWMDYPTNLPSFQTVTVSKAAGKLLKYDVESGGSWNEPDGTKWSVFCFRWKEGDPTARMSAQAHRPEYCLVGGGYDLSVMSGIKNLEAKGIALPFRFYTFDRAGQSLHVFFCLWEDGAETQAGFGRTKQGDRLRTVWAGRRGMGQQTLEIICQGYPDMAAAEQAVRLRLPSLIKLPR